MRRASLSAMLAILAGSAAAAAVAWLARRGAASEPPSATFEEWIAAVERWEAAREPTAQPKDAPPAAAVRCEPVHSLDGEGEKQK